MEIDLTNPGHRQIHEYPLLYTKKSSHKYFQTLPTMGLTCGIDTNPGGILSCSTCGRDGCGPEGSRLSGSYSSETPLTGESGCGRLFTYPLGPARDLCTQQSPVNGFWYATTVLEKAVSGMSISGTRSSFASKVNGHVEPYFLIYLREPVGTL